MIFYKIISSFLCACEKYRSGAGQVKAKNCSQVKMNYEAIS